MTTRPIVPTMIRTEFGDVLDDPSFYEEAGRANDVTFVPGYSDMRRARDIALMEVAQGKRDKKDVPELDVRLQLVRAQRPGRDVPDTRKPIEFSNAGYRAVTRDDVGQPWLTHKATGMEEGPGGELYIGDTKLMVADKQTAARNAAINQIQVKRMLDSRSDGFTRLGETTPGTQPTVTAEKGREITVRRGAKGTEIV